MDRLDGCPRWLKPVMALVYLLKGLMQLLNFFNNEPRTDFLYNYYIVCGCGKNHSYSHAIKNDVGIYEFVCGRWRCVAVSKEQLGLVNKTTAAEFTDKELELLRIIRDVYTVPPDKNIVAVCMFSIFIKAFKMPTIFENHLELYDEPVNR